MGDGSRSADRQEIRALTGVRGLAAGLVILFHFFSMWVLLFPALQPLGTLASKGHLGVDLFFILSGFILCYVYNTSDTALGSEGYRKFVWNRLVRIFPNHVATLGFLIVLVGAARISGITLSGDYPLPGLVSQLTLTHAWPYLGGGEWNYPSWSISAEWFAYLCVFPAVRRLLRVKLGVTPTLAIGYGVLGSWLFFIKPPTEWAPLLQVSCEFITGAMLFSLFAHGGAITRFCQRYASFIFALITLGLAVPLKFVPTGAVVLLFPLLLLGLTAESAMVPKLLSTNVVMWLGRLSFALYMSHALVQKLLKVVLPVEHFMSSPLVTRLGVLSINIIAIMVFATALYYLVEIPARNYLRRLGTSRRPYAAMAAAASD